MLIADMSEGYLTEKPANDFTTHIKGTICIPVLYV